MRWRNWLSAAIGVWLILEPWLLGLDHQLRATYASVIVGAIQAVVSVWAATYLTSQSWKTWQNWVAFACGAWFFIQPFLGHYEVNQYYATVAAGLLTIAVNMWSLIDNRESSRPRHRTQA